MSGVQTSIALQDKLTGPLMKMMKAMDKTIGIMEKMDSSAKSIDTKGLQQARKAIDNASADMARLSSATGNFDNKQKGVNSTIRQGASGFGTLGKSIIAATAAYFSFQAIGNGLGKLASTSDQFISTGARLGNINDGLQTQKELQDKIFQAAQRSRGAYTDMADSVAKLNLLAGDAFGSNDEAIRFSELMNKAFTVSGASTTEKQAGTHQLTQAMASGRLQGDEFRSITENAPMLAVAIAKSMKVSMGELKKLSTEGVITADVIKNALFTAADDIEGKFKTMPVTFSQAMTGFKNEALMIFEPLLKKFSEFVNSDSFGRLAGQALTFVSVSATALMYLFDMIGGIYSALSAIAEYWPIIALGLGIIIGIQLPAMLASLWAMITPILIQAAAWAIVYWPITLVIGAVVALIAVLMYFGVSMEQVLGFVGGLFFALGAVIWNTVANTWNVFAMFAEFLINLFIDPTYAVQKLFYDLTKHVIDNMAAMAGSFDTVADVLGKAFVAGANIAIGGVNMLIKALNAIPGVDISEVGQVASPGAKAFSNVLKNSVNGLVAPTSSKGVVSIGRMDLKSVPGAAKSGYKKGAGLKMPNLGAMGAMGAGGMPPNTGLGDLMGGLGADGKVGKLPKGLGKGKNPTGGKLDSIGKIDDKISIADEDLKMLKELADIRSIQNFQTLQPSITFGDMTIREDADIQKIIKGISAHLKEEMDRSTEGVYT